MYLKAVYVRFFRSFNFDYLRRAHEDFEADPWDLTSTGLEYPFVRVSLERGITTVVGANESGKSQLIAAIQFGLEGDGIRRSDFCRYSQFFYVDDALPYPEFGLELDAISEAENSIIIGAAGLPADTIPSRTLLFRHSPDSAVLHLEVDGIWGSYALSDPHAIDHVLPVAFDINAKVPLPSSISIRALIRGESEADAPSRRKRLSVFKTISDNFSWLVSPETIHAASAEIIEATNVDEAVTEKLSRAGLQLADDLLVGVAGIDRSAFSELLSAVLAGDDGYANAIVQRINTELANALNFKRWWTQDSHFELLVTLRDQDLVFTIRDRTGTEYSFGERSGGLKYFLSYLVQYLAHEPVAGRDEILLMDEPDAYLSSMGQQDLLSIFREFAYPQADDEACQVLYVTHSPFLIDKNHGERIRVLEKGEEDEGTRVVSNAARNHYEPLRSAFGAFVGETTFISGCNLMLEGMSDQVLLAGVSSWARKTGAPRSENLDLNTITMVPAGSASHIPYMVYLARGRDVDRPATLVLLDSDKAGDLARAALAKGGPDGKQLIDQKFVLQLGDVSESWSDIEDLVPLSILKRAAANYATEFIGGNIEARLDTFLATEIDGQAGKAHGLIEKALKSALRGSSGVHVDKVGLARHVVAVVERGPESGQRALVKKSDMDELRSNFQTLFGRLASLQRHSVAELHREKFGSKVRRLRRGFLRDYPDGTSRDNGRLLLEEIELSIGDAPFANEIEGELRAIRRTHQLETEPTEPIEDYTGFSDSLEKLMSLEVFRSLS